MLDEFLWGKVSRISPEAPVPVVEVMREEWFPGGAANVARNLAEFTCGATIVGVTGACEHANRLRGLLTSEGVNVSGIQSHECYQTIVKTRIIARQQHVVRIDRERRLALRAEHAEVALAQVASFLPDYDALILEDYGKGFFSQELASGICRIAKAAGKIVAVDPNPHNPLEWRDVTVIKPNRAEAFASANRLLADPVDPPVDDQELAAVGQILSRKWDAENLLITLGEHGVMLFRDDAPPHHAPTRAREVFDVSGAGDTVIALFTLALSAGATPPEAAEIANHASGVVVGKLGTATVNPVELLASFDV